MAIVAEATVELYRGQWVLNRLVSDRGRFIVALMILDLHFVEGGGAGFTIARLRSEAVAHGVCSPGRVTALLASLRLLGFLKPVAAEDQRERRLAPTDRFLALHRERWQRHFEAIALLRPEGEAALAALDRPAFLGAFAHALVNFYRDGLRMFELVPALRPIGERDAGMVVLLSLLIAAPTGDPVPIAALARRFSVSRAHVLTVLREAAELGLVQPSGPRGGYRAGPRLTTAFRRFFATMLLVQLHGIESARGAGALATSTI